MTTMSTGAVTMNVQELLDAAKDAASIKTDQGLAEAIGVRKQSVSRYRNGIAYPEAVVCEKLAKLSGLPLHRVLGIVGEARAISAAEKKVWRKLATALVLGIVLYVPTVSAANFPTNGSRPCTLCAFVRPFLACA